MSLSLRRPAPEQVLTDAARRFASNQATAVTE